ncbi:hypothetical protein GQ600_15406 [Phytophthora cactorum]|nr:hypothetical protein GQ600_15406 [Phytophthora cactorum]
MESLTEVVEGGSVRKEMPDKFGLMLDGLHTTGPARKGARTSPVTDETAKDPAPSGQVAVRSPLLLLKLLAF